MSFAARILALWLTPVMWLMLPALILAGGPDGLWTGLVLVSGPLVAWSVGASRPETSGPPVESLFPVVTLLLTVTLLLWANLILAGDVVASLGAPRWHGVALTAAGGLLLAAWPGSGRLSVPLVLLLALGLWAPLIGIARDSGMGPVEAWDQVAARPAFRFPPSSPWVADGRELQPGPGARAIVFDEEHRLTASTRGTLRARTREGPTIAEREWELDAGQTVTLRSGDQLRWTPGLRLRFEADRRVPGAPSSGIAWAGGDWDLRSGVGLAVTLLGGALGLLRFGMPDRPSRLGPALVGLGLAAAFLWAQGWAVYAALRAPDLFLGGVSPERLVELPLLALRDGVWGPRLQAALLVAGMAGFLVSSVALRERLGRLDPTGRGELGHDLGLWTAVFAVTSVVSLWPVDPWSLTLLALGVAGSALAPSVVLAQHARRPGIATLAGLVGLGLFLVLSGVSHLRGPSQGALGFILAFPTVVAAPAGGCVLWLAGRAGRR